MKKTNMIIGIAWYRREQYELLRALAVDAESMDNSYEKWLASATKTMNDLHERGIVTRQVDVEVKELIAWCEQRNCPLDGAARSTYAAEHVK